MARKIGLIALQAIGYAALVLFLVWWGHALVTDPCSGDPETWPAVCSK